MNTRVEWLCAGVALGLTVLFACNTSTKAGGGGGTSFQAICMSTCPESCSSDNDCPSGSDVCCNFGGASACVAPQDCPHFCGQSSDCTGTGEVCCQANQASTQGVCVLQVACPTTCSTDSDCSGATTCGDAGVTPANASDGGAGNCAQAKCCGDYAQPVCAPTPNVALCPVSCASDSDCQTSNGERCCSVSVLEKGPSPAISPGEVSASVSGLCLQASDCPTACTTSNDCSSSAGQLCCEGVCATSCPKICNTDNDCAGTNAQLCCTNAAIASVWYGWKPSCGTSKSCSSNGDCPDTSCVDGCCVPPPTCTGSQTVCNDTCVDTATDPKNCGGCGKTCPASCCKGSCSNPSTDNDNCGTCGNECKNGSNCSNGTCLCASGQTSCNGTCTDVSTDRNNCGTCGNVCGNNEACKGGACQCTMATQNASECTTDAGVLYYCPSGPCGGTCWSQPVDCASQASCSGQCSACTACGLTFSCTANSCN